MILHNNKNNKIAVIITIVMRNNLINHIEQTGKLYQKKVQKGEQTLYMSVIQESTPKKQEKKK